ncbi:MAG: DinB family protein [Deltaproteobacteria bacterium]|jgi:hypothetical protein|nr:DinB family protein [Deltaproteobacteria bacterium]
MASVMTDTLLKLSDDYFGMQAKFLEACPEDLWVQKFANWPIWQYFWHVLWINDRFLPGPITPNPAGTTDDSALFKTQNDPVLPLAEAVKGWTAQKPKTDAFIRSLSDKDLLARNEDVFKLIGVDWTNVVSVIKLHSHAFYHLGTFDAALRGKGLAGIY